MLPVVRLRGAVVTSDDVLAHYDARQVRSQLGRLGRCAVVPVAARVKRESDGGIANIPVLVELLNAAVGHVALAFCTGPTRVCSELVEHVSVPFSAPLVDDSQTSGTRCPALLGHF